MSDNSPVGDVAPNPLTNDNSNRMATTSWVNALVSSLVPGGAAAGSAGQVQFNGAPNLAADANLFWDNINKRLGIGITNPGAKLHSADIAIIEAKTAISPAVQYRDSSGGSQHAWRVGIGLNTVIDGIFFIYDDANTTARLSIDQSGNIGLLSPVLYKGISASNSVGILIASGLTTAAAWGVPITGSNATPSIVTYYTGVDELIFGPGTYTISTNLTFPAGKTIRFLSGAVFSIAGGITVTFNSPLVCDHWKQIFTGSGVVRGLAHVRPEWFGTIGDGTLRAGASNDRVGMQLAADCVTNGGTSPAYGNKRLIELRNSGNYHIDSAVILSPDAGACLELAGGGSIFGTSINLDTATANAVALAINARSDGTTANSCVFYLHDFAMRRTSVAANSQKGLVIGANSSAGVTVGGITKSRVEDILIADFPTNIEITDTRQVTFSRVISNGQNTKNFAACFITTTANFTGDMDFKDCQFAPRIYDGTETSYCVFLNSQVGGVGISGIGFDTCIFYNATESVFMEAIGSGAGGISDIWFNPRCQFDNGHRSIHLLVSGAGTTIMDINVNGCYFQGNTDFVVYGETAAGGVFNHFLFNNNRVNGTTATAAFQMINVNGLSICGNLFGNSVCSTAVILLDTTTDVVLNSALTYQGGGLSALGLSVATSMTNGSLDVRAFRNGVVAQYSTAGAVLTNVGITQSSAVL